MDTEHEIVYFLTNITVYLWKLRTYIVATHEKETYNHTTLLYASHPTDGLEDQRGSSLLAATVLQRILPLPVSVLRHFNVSKSRFRDASVDLGLVSAIGIETF